MGTWLPLCPSRIITDQSWVGSLRSTALRYPGSKGQVYSTYRKKYYAQLSG
jgi:hypothetical protein